MKVIHFNRLFYSKLSRMLPAVVILALSVSNISGATIIEEVIVTAQKREQNLQDVGISMTAFSGDQVKEMGFTNTVDVVSMTPGFNITTPAAEGATINFFLRGVGLNDFQDTSENPVGAYFDEVYRGAMGGLHLQLFDIERVEVLRGPQGTLYGRNTSGGLVHFISKKPTEEFEGYGEISYGSYDELKFEAAVGGKITEGLLGRASMATNNNSGYVENRFPGVDDFNETDALAARGQLLWDITNNIELLATIHYSNNFSQVGAWQHGVSVVTENGDNRRNVGPDEDVYGTGPGNSIFGYRDRDGDPHAGEYDRDGKLKTEADGVSGKLTWQINDNLSLTSITAYDLTDRLQQEDTESTPFPLLLPAFGADTQQWTQEFRLHGDFDTFRWLGGFYYYNQEIIADGYLDTTNLGFVYFDVDIDQNTESWATFGQFEYDLTPEWSVIAGIRYTEEKKVLNYESIETTGLFELATLGIIPPEAFGLTEPPPLTNERPTPSHAALYNQQTVGDSAVHDKSSVTGKVGIDYRPNDDWLIYASFSRGVKSAGFNTGFLDATFIFASNTVETIPYDAETLHSYELGFKGTLFDGSVRLNGAVFYYDYMDYQTYRFELLNAIVFNTDAEIYGGELELQATLGEKWDFAFGLSVLDATAKKVPSAGTGTLKDRTMVAAPDVALTGLARYEWPFILDGTAAIIAKFNFQTEVFYDIQNYDNAREGSYVVGDVRVQWTSADDHWQVAAFVNNVADAEYITYTFDFAGPFGFNQEAYGKPRWFGGSIAYRW